MQKLLGVAILIVFKLGMIANDCSQVDKSNQSMSDYRYQMNQAYNRE